MPNTRPGKSGKKKIEKFKLRHAEGRKEFAAQKKLDNQVKKQKAHQARGRKGHNPRPKKYWDKG